MTPEELIVRVRELDQDATPGPWQTHPCHTGGMSVWVGRQVVVAGPIDSRNADLISEYRTAAPALADRLERACELLRAAQVSLACGGWSERQDKIVSIVAFLTGETTE